MTANGKSTLRIYIGRHCWSCDEAVRLAEDVRKRFTELNVELVDVEAEGSVNHDDIFTIPTYVFNGHSISLGNPTPEELFAKVSASLVELRDIQVDATTSAKIRRFPTCVESRLNEERAKRKQNV